MNGVHTVHLPSSSSTNVNLRLFFSPQQASPLNLEAFDGSDKRIARLELNFLLGHVQINWNGLLSSWHRVHNTANHLELALSTQSFKLNGKLVSVTIPEPVTQQQPAIIKVNYQETATPDAYFLEILDDQELVDSLEMMPIWQSPLESVQVIQPEVEAIFTNLKSIDYLVYGTQSLDRLQIAINSPLPRLEVRRTNRTLSLFNTLKSLLIVRSKAVHLPVLHSSKGSHSNARIFGIIAASAFILYLALLLKLSRMTSIRDSRTTSALPAVKQQLNTVEYHPVAISKSFSQNKLTLDFTDAPHLKSSFSATGSVLKVTIPAAFSLADNRHILFPSKLRNFQK